MLNVDKTYSIEEFVKCDKDLISYNKLALYQNLNDKKFITYDLINEYLDEIKELAVDVEFSNDEYIQYKYKPKLLSYNVYGSTELFFIILAINGICNVKDFDFKKVKMLHKESMQYILSYIYNNELKNIENNRLNLTKEED